MKTYEQFNEEKNTLYTFDLDNTLIKNIKFEKEVKKLLLENYSLKELIKQELKKINIDLDDLNYENDRIYINDPNKIIKIPIDSLWTRKKDRIYLKTPENFFLYDEGRPINVNEYIVNLYNSVENKSILTIRKDIFRSQTINLLNELNIDYPNNGLYMYPYSIIKNKSKWKLEILLKLLNNFNKIRYYDDDIKILKGIRNKLYDENIELYHVKNDKIRLIKIN